MGDWDCEKLGPEVTLGIVVIIFVWELFCGFMIRGRGCYCALRDSSSVLVLYPDLRAGCL